MTDKNTDPDQEVIGKVWGYARVSTEDQNLDMQIQALEKYGTDLTARAREGKIDPVIGRNDEIRRVLQVLSRRTKNNPVLVGEAGVGKTAIIEGLAFAIQNRTAPSPLLDRRIVQIEIGTLVAGTSLRGQFEERLIGIVEEIKRAENIILFIDEIHTIVGAGDTIDSNLDDEWSVEWGDELHSAVVGSRIFAALGFDVDHPYYRKKNSVTVVFPKHIALQSKNADEMQKSIKKIFNIDISAFISKVGIVTEKMATKNVELKPYIGLHFARFIECVVEGRPDRVKRLVNRCCRQKRLARDY